MGGQPYFCPQFSCFSFYSHIRYECILAFFLHKNTPSDKKRRSGGVHFFYVVENLKNTNKKSVFLRKMSILSTNECSFIQNGESYPHLSTEKGVKRLRFYAKKESKSCLFSYRTLRKETSTSKRTVCKMASFNFL